MPQWAIICNLFYIHVHIVHRRLLSWADWGAPWDVPCWNQTYFKWWLCRKSMDLPLVLFVVPLFQSAEEEAASCFTVPLRPNEHARIIPTVTLFIWPFTWREETGRQCSCVCKDNLSPASVLALQVSDVAHASIIVRSALMMLNNILHYFKWGCGNAQCHSCRKGSKGDVYLRKQKWFGSFPSAGFTITLLVTVRIWTDVLLDRQRQKMWNSLPKKSILSI